MNNQDYRKLSSEELKNLRFYATSIGNLNAALEISQFIEMYGKEVEVVKGRKVPLGTIGIVFFVKRYGFEYWNSYTRVGFKNEAGKTFFTDYHNLKIIGKETRA